MPVVATTRSWLRRLRGTRRRRPQGREKRRDPRTDHLYSLRNLLRTRCSDLDWPNLAIGTSYDVLIAAKDEDGCQGEALLIDSREAIESGIPEPAAIRFAVGGQVLILAADTRASVPLMLEVAERVRRIMLEKDRFVRFA